MRQKRCCCFCFFFFFFRNGVESRRIFFFFFLPRGQQRRWKKSYSSSYEGKNRRTKPEALQLPRPSSRARDREHPGKGRALPASAPRGRTDSPLCRMPAPSGSPASCGQVDLADPAGMLAARAEPPDTSPEPRTVPEPVHPAGDRGSPSPLPALGGDGEPGLPLRAGPGCWRSGSSFSSRSPPTCALPVGFYASVCALIIPVFVSRNAYVRDTQQYFKS